MMDLKFMVCRLEGLTVFRALLQDPVIQDVRHMLGAAE